MTARDARGWFTHHPIDHGTHNGAAQHARRHEPPCEPCRLARNAYNRLHRGASPSEPAPPLQLDRARELADLGLLHALTARQLAEQIGRTPRTIQRYRAALRRAA